MCSIFLLSSEAIGIGCGRAVVSEIVPRSSEPVGLRSADRANVPSVSRKKNAMKSSRLLALLAILVVPASFVSSSALCAKARATDGPTLLAVELQPEDPMPGGQFVWILNPSTEELDLSCWVLRSEKAGVLMIVKPGLQLPAGGVAHLVPGEAWVAATEQIRLLDPQQRVVDETPELTDDRFDDQFWFRDPGGQWQFGRTSLPRKPVSGHLSSGAVSGCAQTPGGSR